VRTTRFWNNFETESYKETSFYNGIVLIISLPSLLVFG